MAAIVLASTENMPYAEWLEWRRKGIGGSDASVVCGVNKWKSPVELWMDKTGQLPYDEAGEAAYWGTVLESVVKAEFSKRTGIEVMPVNQLLQSESHPFMPRQSNSREFAQIISVGANCVRPKTTENVLLGPSYGGRTQFAPTGTCAI